MNTNILRLHCTFEDALHCNVKKCFKNTVRFLIYLKATTREDRSLIARAFLTQRFT